MTAITPYTDEILYTQDAWFNGFVSQLRQHQAQIKDKTLSQSLTLLYNTLFVGNANELAHPFGFHEILFNQFALQGCGQRFQEVHGAHSIRLSDIKGSALSDGDLQGVEALLVERGRKLVIRLIVAGLHHLFFEIDAVSARPDFEFRHLARVGPRTLGASRQADMRGVGHGKAATRRRGTQWLREAGPGLAEIGTGEVARLEAGQIGVGDVLGQELLAGLVPLHARAQHAEDGKVGDGHGAGPSPRPEESARWDRQNLPPPWLTPG